MKMTLIQKVKDKMNTEEFIKNYKYQKVRVKIGKTVNNGFRKSMKLLWEKDWQTNKLTTVKFNDVGIMPDLDEFSEAEDLFDLVYDIKKGKTGLEVQ